MEAGANVDQGELLVRFAESAVRNDSDLDFARSNLESAIGASGVVEAAATVSAFEGLNRIADATGIQLDSGLADESVDFRRTLGLDGYAGARSTELNGVPRRAEDVLSIFR